MPARRGANSGHKTVKAPNAPSTWSHRRSAGAECGKRADIVAGAGIDRAGGRDDAEWHAAGSAILPHRLAQAVDVDPELGIDIDASQRGIAEPQQFESLGYAGVAFARYITGQPRAIDAVSAHVMQRLVTRRSEAEEICHRTAGRHQAAGRRRKIEPLRHPADDAFLQVNGAVIPAAAIRVYGCSRHFGKQAARGAAAVYPTPKSRMGIAGAIGQDQLAKRGANFVQGARLARRCFGQLPFHAFRHRRPDRPVAGMLEPGDQVIQKRVRFAAECLPIGGIER